MDLGKYVNRELAVRSDLTTDALRFYEREGLLAPSAKSEGGYRLYDDSAVARLRFVQHAQQCGFTLAEIRELLSLQSRESACCDDVRRRVVEKKLQLEARIKKMQAMSTALDALIAGCNEVDQPLFACPILNALERAEEVQA
ncbi:MAG: heavy metal-responsive transcriptional regulator [Ramlibacter sp.]|nr:heavy metal-responsive transcriptional regulator [Ramlibacter sp.]